MLEKTAIISIGHILKCLQRILFGNASSLLSGHHLEQKVQNDTLKYWNYNTLQYTR